MSNTGLFERIISCFGAGDSYFLLVFKELFLKKWGKWIASRLSSRTKSLTLAMTGRGKLDCFALFVITRLYSTLGTLHSALYSYFTSLLTYYAKLNFSRN
ncbi:MAG: hypothetical protein DLD55_05385 [candidate division SR1 bacterium]|nr:MAG: hypothetical protein DLD55_05385 [candidate division SR1 bacterium]